MRKQILIVAAVAVLALAGSSLSYAQAPVTRVSVPFQFIVGDVVLPAGSYVVSNVRETPDTVSVCSEDGKSVAVVLVNLADKPLTGTNAMFSFAKIGGLYFLSTINTPGTRTQVIPLPKQRIETMLAKLNGTQPRPRVGHPSVR